LAFLAEILIISLPALNECSLLIMEITQPFILIYVEIKTKKWNLPFGPYILIVIKMESDYNLNLYTCSHIHLKMDS
jgi:hypothetical protein